MPQMFQHKLSNRAGGIFFFAWILLISGCKTPNLTLNADSPVEVITAPLRQAIESVPPNGIVEVRKGDTLFAIASRYQVTPQSVIENNNLTPPYQIRPGQPLKITPPRSHVVTVEDTVYSLSQRYAVSQYQLAQLNGLTPPFSLEVGQRLQLPSSLDFSVLDTGLPKGLRGTGADQPTPTPVASTAPNLPRKRFVAPSSGLGGFQWPVKGEVIAEFGPSARGVHNDGVNIAAKAGTVVGAAAKGTVAFVGDNIKSFGRLVLIKHDGGIITAYAHLGQVTVREGDIVTAGQALGTVGSSGRVTTPQLHFEIRKTRQPIDPRRMIS